MYDLLTARNDYETDNSMAKRLFLRDGACCKRDFEEMLAASPFRKWRVEERGISLYMYLFK